MTETIAWAENEENIHYKPNLIFDEVVHPSHKIVKKWNMVNAVNLKTWRISDSLALHRQAWEHYCNTIYEIREEISLKYQL